MLKAVAYIRNDERYLQRIEIENYCKRNAIDLEATFYDEGVSGLDEDRLSYQKLFKYISKNKVDLVLVYRPEKLTRDMNKIKELIKEFKREKIGLVSVLNEVYLTDMEIY